MNWQLCCVAPIPSSAPIRSVTARPVANTKETNLMTNPDPIIIDVTYEPIETVTALAIIDIKKDNPMTEETKTTQTKTEKKVPHWQLRYKGMTRAQALEAMVKRQEAK